MPQLTCASKDVLALLTLIFMRRRDHLVVCRFVDPAIYKPLVE